MAASAFANRPAENLDAVQPGSIFSVPMTNAAIKEALKAASSDLLFLWDQCKVGLEMQARLIGMGFTDVDVFAKVEDTSAELRALLKTELKFKEGSAMLGKAGNRQGDISMGSSCHQRHEKKDGRSCTAGERSPPGDEPSAASAFDESVSRKARCHQR